MIIQSMLFYIYFNKYKSQCKQTKSMAANDNSKTLFKQSFSILINIGLCGILLLLYNKIFQETRENIFLKYIFLLQALETGNGCNV